MYCKICGAPVSENARFCENCGAPIAAKQPRPEASKPSDTVIPPRPSQNEPPFVHAEPMGQNGYGYAYGQQTNEQRPKPSLSFEEAIREFFNRYTDFDGRSVRSAYWWPCLLSFIVNTALSSIPHMKWLSALFSLVILIPGLACCVRRLHDVGYSGKYFLMILIPIFGAIWLIVKFCQESVGDNQWGLSPARNTFEQ